MNNKGQMAQVGTFLVVFIGVIVALSLLNGGIYENIGKVTLTKSVSNSTVTFPTIDGVLVLEGQAVSDVIVTNATAGATVPASNYTITNYDASTGTLRATLTGLNATTYNNASVNVSYTYEPLGYAKESGTRSIMSIIAIFASLAVVGVIIVKIYSDGLFNFG